MRGGGHEIGRGHTAGATAHVFNGAERQRLIAVPADIAAQLVLHGIVPVTVRTGPTGYGTSVENEAKALFGPRRPYRQA